MTLDVIRNELQQGMLESLKKLVLLKDATCILKIYAFEI